MHALKGCVNNANAWKCGELIKLYFSPSIRRRIKNKKIKQKYTDYFEVFALLVCDDGYFCLVACERRDCLMKAAAGGVPPVFPTWSEPVARVTLYLALTKTRSFGDFFWCAACS